MQTMHRIKQNKTQILLFYVINIFLYCSKGPSGNTSSSFRFLFEKRGGRGLKPAGNTKPEEKLEENRGGGG